MLDDARLAAEKPEERGGRLEATKERRDARRVDVLRAQPLQDLGLALHALVLPRRDERFLALLADRVPRGGGEVLREVQSEHRAALRARDGCLEAEGAARRRLEVEHLELLGLLLPPLLTLLLRSVDDELQRAEDPFESLA